MPHDLVMPEPLASFCVKRYHAIAIKVVPGPIATVPIVVGRPESGEYDSIFLIDSYAAPSVGSAALFPSAVQPRIVPCLAMLAIYRMEVDGWNIERAYQEMKDYDFYTRFGHGCYKNYVYDYNRALQTRNQANPASSAKTAVTPGQQE